MSSNPQRPTVFSARSHRLETHPARPRRGLPAAPRTLDRVLAGLGFAGLGFYLYKNYQRLSAYELAGLSVSSFTLGYGLFDLGRRNGLIQGARFMLRHDEEAESSEEEDWRGEFKGKEYEDLQTAEKIAWLHKEEKRIRDTQADDQFKCGQAYIAKEEAYAKYEKHGGYGGRDWKTYNSADKTCQRMYEDYQKQQKRLGQIRIELNELNELL